MQHPVHATSLLVHLARLYTYVHKYYGRRILHSVLCRSAPFIFAGQSNTPGALVRRWQISSPAKWFWECVVHCQCRVSARVWWVCMNNEHACVLWSFVCLCVWGKLCGWCNYTCLGFILEAAPREGVFGLHRQGGLLKGFSVVLINDSVCIGSNCQILTRTLYLYTPLTLAPHISTLYQAYTLPPPPSPPQSQAAYSKVPGESRAFRPPFSS